MGAPVEAQNTTVTLFTAVSDAQKKVLLGNWFESEAMLLLVWTTVEIPAEPAAQAPQAPQAPAAPEKTPKKAPGKAPAKKPVAPQN